MRVALLALDVQEALGARPARFVDDDDRPRGQLVLLGDAVDETGHLVGAAAGAGRDDEFDLLRRLPGGGDRGSHRDENPDKGRHE